MNKNIFAQTITQELIDRVERERTETMSKKEFIQWCNELRISASYVDSTIHGDRASAMMDMIDRDEWIATFKRHNRIT
jgi:N-acetylglucosamine-6-phosphate deacetylase